MQRTCAQKDSIRFIIGVDNKQQVWYIFDTDKLIGSIKIVRITTKVKPFFQVMENVMDQILSALFVVLAPKMLFLIFSGTFIGIVVGALPGLSATLGVAILLPVTYYLLPAEGLLLLLGIYTGGIYGGSIAAILLNIPGCPASLMTSLDGYPMTLRGEGGKAIGIATVSSFIGGTLGVFALIFVAPLLAKAALSFGPAEYATLALFGLSAIVMVVAQSAIKGFIGVCVGLLAATVGMDPMVSVPRFTYGSIDLMSGINYIPVVIGLFGLCEVFTQAFDTEAQVKIRQKVTQVFPRGEDMKAILYGFFHPSWIGTLIGALPGAGGSIAAIISYNRAQAMSKTPEKFGTGLAEGIVACETANNASIGGAMVPLMTLGIPGSSVTAVLLGAMLMHNINPGPMLFVTNADLVYTIFLGMMMANVAMLILGISCAKISPNIVNLPRSVLLPIITLLCIIGAYSMGNSIFDVGTMLASGILGFVFRQIGISSGPIILGLILGPIAEANFRAAMELSNGSFSIFVSSPLSAGILLVTVALLAFPFIRKAMSKKNNALR